MNNSPAAKRLSVATIRSLLDYNPDTGSFIWKPRYPDYNDWNARFVGKVAGTTKGTRGGYRRISLFDRAYPAHRLAWAIAYGEYPAFIIDHANGDPADNRLVNLRRATAAQNAWNSKGLTAVSRSGVKGVTPSRGRWRAMIKVHGRSTHLGRFDTIEEAEEAYLAAARRSFGEFARSARRAP